MLSGHELLCSEITYLFESMFQIKINSRKLINLIMNQFLELDAVQSKKMVQLFDKKDKLRADTFVSQAREIFKPEQVESGLEKLYQLIKAKTLADLPESIAQTESVKEVQILFTLLAERGVNSVTFDITLMRGFDYYTDIVFEVFDLDPENNRSMFGGGRYDGLVGNFGVEQIATVGFGMGDAPIENFLASHKLEPKLRSSTDIYVVTIGDVLGQAQDVVKKLRSQGINLAVDLTDRKPEKQIKAALKLAVPYLLFIGEDEISNKKYILRNVETQKEDVLSIDEIMKVLQ